MEGREEGELWQGITPFGTYRVTSNLVIMDFWECLENGNGKNVI